MRWVRKRRTIRPLIPVCLMAVIFVVFSSSIVFAQAPRTLVKVKDLPTIFPDPNIHYGDAGDDPNSRYNTLGASAIPEPDSKKERIEILPIYFDPNAGLKGYGEIVLRMLNQAIFGF